jgi:hypothetical protein
MLMRGDALGRLLSCCRNRNRHRRLARSSVEGDSADKSPLRLFMLRASRVCHGRPRYCKWADTEAALRAWVSEDTGASEVSENRQTWHWPIVYIYVCSWLPRSGASRISSHQSSRVPHFPAATRRIDAVDRHRPRKLWNTHRPFFTHNPTCTQRRSS